MPDRSLNPLSGIEHMDSVKSPSKRSQWFILGAIALLVLVVIILGAKAGFEMTRPVSIQPLSTIPPEWNVPAGKKIDELSEYFVEYKLVGKLPGKPNDQFHLVVHGPDPTPYMRIVYGDDLQKGGRIGLAVPKRRATYRASLRGYDFKGNGPRYSNVLTFTY
jgi:hypothetical protein